MPSTLSDHLDQMEANIEALWSSIETTGSDEQQQLVSAMRQTMRAAASHYEQPIPPGQGEAFFMWRHEAIRPVSLCINSAELLLTDEDHPLDTSQQHHAQHILDTALAINSIIDDIFNQRIRS